MDNPQHYQPLSHALHPPLAANSQLQQPYTPTGMYRSKSTAAVPSIHREEEEEEDEEEEDDDDEGLVEAQLSRNEPDNQLSNPSSPQTKAKGCVPHSGGVSRVWTDTIQKHGRYTKGTYTATATTHRATTKPRARTQTPPGSPARLQEQKKPHSGSSKTRTCLLLPSPSTITLDRNKHRTTPTPRC